LIPWVVDIQEVVAGVPTGVVLSSTAIAPENFPLINVLPSPGEPLSLSVAMNVGIPLQAGDQFAIVLHPEGVTGAPGLLAGNWAGSTGYVGGAAVTGPDSDSLTIFTGGVTTTYDLHFRTFMYVVPEPSNSVLLAIGVILASIVQRKRRREANTRILHSSYAARRAIVLLWT
jgi:hypothetical protein